MAAKSESGLSGFSGTTKSTRYKFCEDLESFKGVLQKRFVVHEGYGDFNDVPKDVVSSQRELFRTLYQVYDAKPFIEPLEEQLGNQDEVMEVTFGISEDCTSVLATVSSLDDWLVDNKTIGIEYDKGFCTLTVPPQEGQYGDCVMTVQIEDPVGRNQHSFRILFMEKKNKKTKKKRSAARNKRGFEEDPFVDSDSEESDEERPQRDKNPRRWTTEQVGEWCFESNVAILRMPFVEANIDGTQLLALTEEDLTNRFKVKKMKLRKQLIGWVEKLNDDADMAEYQEEQDKIAEEERVAARAKEAERRAADDRPGTRGSMATASSVMSLSRPGTTGSAVDAWACQVPSIYHRACTKADMDAYIVAFEIGKVQHVHNFVLRDGVFVNLTADDMRVCISAALSAPFVKIIGIEARIGEFERGKVFLKRYKQKFMPGVSDAKRSQSLNVMHMEPLKYDGIAKATVLWIDWRFLRDEFNLRQKRCYQFQDIERALKWQPNGTILFVVNNDAFPVDEDADAYSLETKVPGNNIDNWTRLDETLHDFSDGTATVYCYRRTGERHQIVERNVYGEDFYSGSEEDESSEEEEYDDEDEDVVDSDDVEAILKRDVVAPLPKDKLRRYVQTMYRDNEEWTSFVNSSRDMLLSRGIQMSRSSTRGSMAESHEKLFGERPPIQVRGWRSEYDPEFERIWTGPRMNPSRQGSQGKGLIGASAGSRGGSSSKSSLHNPMLLPSGGSDQIGEGGGRDGFGGETIHTRNGSRGMSRGSARNGSAQRSRVRFSQRYR